MDLLILDAKSIQLNYRKSKRIKSKKEKLLTVFYYIEV